MNGNLARHSNTYNMFARMKEKEEDLREYREEGVYHTRSLLNLQFFSASYNLGGKAPFIENCIEREQNIYSTN